MSLYYLTLPFIYEGVNVWGAVLLTRTLEQGPGQGPGLRWQGPGPGLGQGPGQGQGLESEGQAPRQ